MGGIATNGAFAGTDVDDVGIGGSDGDGADGAEVDVAIGDGFPGVAAVDGLEDAAAGSAEVVDERLAGHARNGVDATTAEGANLAKGEGIESTGGARGCCGRRSGLRGGCRLGRERGGMFGFLRDYGEGSDDGQDEQSCSETIGAEKRGFRWQAGHAVTLPGVEESTFGRWKNRNDS